MNDNLTTQELSRKEIRTIKHREYYLKNKEKRKQAVRAHYLSKRKLYLKRSKQKRKYLSENELHQLRKYAKLHYVQNKQKYSEKGRSYRKTNSLILKEKHKAYIEKNKDKIRQKRANAWKQKYYSDAMFKLKCGLRSRINSSIKNSSSTTARNRIKFEVLLGCTLEEAKIYIEKQFIGKMSWDNHGKKTWHIDHIKPVSTFDFTDIEQLKECFHYTNLRPLQATDNLSRPKDGRDILIIN